MKKIINIPSVSKRAACDCADWGMVGCHSNCASMRDPAKDEINLWMKSEEELNEKWIEMYVRINEKNN